MTTTGWVVLAVTILCALGFAGYALVMLLKHWHEDRIDAQAQREDLIAMLKDTHGALLRVKNKPTGAALQDHGSQSFPPRTSTPRSPMNGDVAVSRDVGFPVRK